MKNDKITAEVQDTDKLGKLCSERKACRRNGCQHLPIGQTNVLYIYITYVAATKIEV